MTENQYKEISDTYYLFEQPAPSERNESLTTVQTQIKPYQIEDKIMMYRLKTFLLPILLILPLSLSGCGTEFNPERMEVTLNTEYSPGGLYDRTYVILTIRSLDANPITLNKVDVNNGRCGYTARYRNPIQLPAHFQMGQALELYLNCSYESIVKVDIETDQGAASYHFK